MITNIMEQIFIIPQQTFHICYSYEIGYTLYTTPTRSQSNTKDFKHNEKSSSFMFIVTIITMHLNNGKSSSTVISTIILSTLLLAVVFLTGSISLSPGSFMAFGDKGDGTSSGTTQQDSNGPKDGSSSDTGKGDSSGSADCGKKCEPSSTEPSSTEPSDCGKKCEPPPSTQPHNQPGTPSIPGPCIDCGPGETPSIPGPCIDCGPGGTTVNTPPPVGPYIGPQPTPVNTTIPDLDSTRSRIITLVNGGIAMQVNSTLNVRNVDPTGTLSSDGANINADDFSFVSQGANNTGPDYQISPILNEQSDDGIKDVYVSIPGYPMTKNGSNTIPVLLSSPETSGITSTFSASSNSYSQVIPAVFSPYTIRESDQHVPLSSLVHFVSHNGGGHHHKHHHHHHLVVYYSVSPECRGQIRDNNNQLQQCVITIIPRSASHMSGSRPTVVMIPDMRNDYSGQYRAAPRDIHINLGWTGSESGSHPSQSFSANQFGRISSFTTNDRSVEFRITADPPSDYRQSFSYGCTGIVRVGDIAFCNMGYDSKPPDSNTQPRVTFFTIPNNNQPSNAYFVHVIDTSGESHLFKGSSTGQSIFLSPGSQYRSWISGPSGALSKSGACSGVAQIGNDLSCTYTIGAPNSFGQQTADATIPNYSPTDLQRLQQPGVIIR